MEPIGIGMGVPEPQRRDLEMMEARLWLMAQGMEWGSWDQLLPF